MSRKKILIVSRNNELIDSLSRELQNSNIKILSCKSLKSLISIGKNNTIHISVIDIESIVDLNDFRTILKATAIITQDCNLYYGKSWEIDFVKYPEMDGFLDSKLSIEEIGREIKIYKKSLIIGDDNGLYISKKAEGITPKVKEALLEKDRRITSLYAQVFEYKKTLEKLKYKIVENTKEELVELKKMVRDIDSFNVEWDNFLEAFVRIHPKFHKKLLDKYPKITNENLKMCSFLKMGLTNKEISMRYGINHQSVLQNQTRLKQKLNLPKEQSLRNFIKSL